MPAMFTSKSQDELQIFLSLFFPKPIPKQFLALREVALQRNSSSSL